MKTWVTRALHPRDLTFLIREEMRLAEEDQWGEDDYRDHAGMQAMNSHCVVVTDLADPLDRPIGILVYVTHKAQMEIRRLHVARGWRRGGAASELVNRLKTVMRQRRYRLIDFPVSERLTDLHLFLQAHGFTAVVLRKRHEDDEQFYRFTFRTEQLKEELC